MSTTLIEKYSKRIAVSESIYAREHNGAKMSTQRKTVIAACLDNLNRYMNESFDAASATQRSDLGQWKKFCLNLTNVALPNLIAFDLVMVHPMTSMSGYVTYLEYTAGQTKGQTTRGDVFNSPFALGEVDANYTGATVVETIEEDGKVAWRQFGKFGIFDEDHKFIEGSVKTQDGEIKAEADLVAGDKVTYIYNNIEIPQEKLPTLNAKMNGIPLVAHARRIAIFYSQIAAFESKTDYGFDLGDQLAEKAVGQLNYEIDTEIVELLHNTAKENTTEEELGMIAWSKTQPVGVSKKEHFEGFMEIVELAKTIVYNRTRRFVPNYMICAADIIPVLSFIDAFQFAPQAEVNGPYLAGTLGSLKVFVSPAMDQGEYVIGVNGNDMMSSVAVYAPYMAVIPTQLLQFADGTTSQGFSTMYDLKVLNPRLAVYGKIDA